ncbi:hypothetical protein [Streptomyces sp. NPDC086782]|uniref:hypothetical protein n=1 Tax=Streptomyces sp. NPDC086782 TaxID=3365757 RepID=UPI00382EB9CB
MSMAQLVAAGAPELPEGFFYRVRPFLAGSSITVQVRRQRRFIGSEELAHAIVVPADHDGALAAVVAGCRKSVQRWEESGDLRRAMHDASFFIGDHDPKGGK